VGFSNGADPLYQEFRRHIGAFYLTPAELFRASFPGLAPRPDQLTVVSWILPSTARTRAEQAAQKRRPSERWARTRFLGEACNDALRRHLAAVFLEAGIPAVAPLLSPVWRRLDQGPYAPCSNWSERHAAYAAGLGTFGFCDGLITPVGKAVRVGSLVALARIQPTPRPYQDHHAYCLFYRRRSCLACARRCPVGALTDKGHDKRRCMRYTERAMNRYIRKAYGLDTYACGLCQAGVPCMDRIPE